MNEIVERIVKIAQPEKIILFGSAARGEMGPHAADLERALTDAEAVIQWAASKIDQAEGRGLGFLNPVRLRATDSSYPPALVKHLAARAPNLTAIGALELLNEPLLGFLCSRKAPGSVIVRVYDWARQARDTGTAVIGGFRSAMERECLDFLLRGTQPVIVAVDRGLGSMEIPAEWQEPIARGRLLVVSPFEDHVQRTSSSLAARRNRVVAALAGRVLVAHASPGGNIDKLVHEILAWGKPLYTLDDPANAALLERGARPWP